MDEVTPANKWTLRGRLTDDVRINSRLNGPGRIANFRLAVNEPHFYQGEIETRELFINVAVFDTAVVDEIERSGIAKGDRVEVTGRCALKTEKWEDRTTGEPRERTLNELQVTPGMAGFGFTVLDRKNEPADATAE